MRRGLLLALLLGTALAVPAAARGGEVEVVVTLDAPPLARAVSSSRALSAAAKERRLSLASPTSVAYLRALDADQRALERRIRRAVPQARVRWRYDVVLNGLAVVVPAERVGWLAAVPGVARVWPNGRYTTRLDQTPARLGAPTLWGSDLSFAGQGVKIGIIDDGIDQTHPFFDPRGYSAPPGFPKGDRTYTTAKVIVAKAFPPARPRWRHAAKPFDPQHSEHGTHVAGIAAGNLGVFPAAARGRVSGMAPRAYLGNYKVLTIPTASGVGLDGNAAEIAAAIEAAVQDGMDIVNLSIGEPEIAPERDLVVRAIDAAAAAGVVPVVAAGNDFSDFGAGSISSPGSAPGAITAAAVDRNADAVAAFSSAGPAPVSLGLKPDIAAPGVDVLSSVPSDDAPWSRFSGTSMAAPHIAGAAALLRQRHPGWTAGQVKSALMITARPVRSELVTRVGAGLLDVVAADAPLVFVEPASVSFGLLRPGGTVGRALTLSDAGGGGGTWAVTVATTGAVGATVTAPSSVSVPGTLELAAAAPAGAAEGETSGVVILTRGDQVRRIPFWTRVNVPSLEGAPATVLRRPGIYRSSTAGRPARASAYLYPERAPGVVTRLDGPEQLFRVGLTRPVANFGVAVLSRARGVQVQPRVVMGADESRLAGYAALPLSLNPYLPTLGQVRLVAGVVRPQPGSYTVVFDSPGAGAGAFTFRFWMNDTMPPRLRLLTPRIPRGRPVFVRASDAGSGIDPASISASVDGAAVSTVFSSGRIRVDTQAVARGRHRLVIRVSDFQESRNMENVPLILPNTRQLTATIVVR